MTSAQGFDTVLRMTTLVLRLAEAFLGTRPKGDGPAMEQWGDDLVAVASALGLDEEERGAFFRSAGGL